MDIGTVYVDIIMDIVHFLLLCAENLGMLEKVGRYIKYRSKSKMMKDEGMALPKIRETVGISLKY